jgi:hypothetical protein
VPGLSPSELVRGDIPHMPDSPLSHLKRLNELMKDLVEQVGFVAFVPGVLKLLNRVLVVGSAVCLAGGAE